MKKNVNFIIGTLSEGGAERVVSNITLGLDTTWNRTIVLFGKKSKIVYEYHGQLVYLDKDERKRGIFLFLTYFKRVKLLKKLKIYKSKSINVSFLEFPNLINILSKNNDYTVLSVRNYMSSKHRKGIKARFWNCTIKYLYPKADCIVAVSNEIKLDLIENYKIPEQKIVTIYNPYDFHKIQQMSREVDDLDKFINYKGKTIITAGRLNDQKGQWHLIRSFAKVKEDISNVRLLILGEGPLYQYLTELVEQLGLTDSVYFLGFVKNPFKYFYNSDLFVLTSFYEGFPNALAEAMVCGIPVLSTDCKSGPRELLAPNEVKMEVITYGYTSGRFGSLVPVCDGIKHASDVPLTKEESILCNEIIQILSSTEYYSNIKKSGMKRILDFSSENIIGQWSKLFDSFI